MSRRPPKIRKRVRPGAITLVVLGLVNCGFEPLILDLGTPTVTSIEPIYGPDLGGTQVLIEGASFLPGVAVHLGDAPAKRSWCFRRRSSVFYLGPSQGAHERDGHLRCGSLGVLSDAYAYVGSPLLDAINPSGGHPDGGTRVTLSGENFTPGMQVSVGEQNCDDVTLLDGGRLMCTTRAHAPGLVDVSVTDGVGRTAMLAGGFTYRLPPSISEILPNKAAASGGSLLTMRGERLMQGVVVLLGEVICQIDRHVSSQELTCVAPAQGAGSVDVTVTNPDGQFVVVTDGLLYVNSLVVTPLSPVMITGESLFLRVAGGIKPYKAEFLAGTGTLVAQVDAGSMGQGFTFTAGNSQESYGSWCRTRSVRRFR
ncbi:MAG: IPT/TIG domain-containing protein [Myxococcota bacterium]